jgi:hypothetical protein
MLTDSAFWIVVNHIQQNCFRAANSSWDNQETAHILWNLEGSVLCLQEPITLQNQMNPVHSHPLYFFNIHFDDIFPFVPRSFNWFLSLRFPHQTSICFSHHLCMCHMPCPYHHFLFAHPNISNGDGGGTVVKVLSYKSEGRWFDSRWFHWNFSLT